MASSGYTRVLVHLRKTSAVESYQKAKFSECILDFLGFCGDGMVECHLEDNRLLIQPSAMANTLENTKMATNLKKTPSYKLVVSTEILILKNFCPRVRTFKPKMLDGLHSTVAIFTIAVIAGHSVRCLHS